ncbi:E3 ubiquitin-protein ligase MBR2 [Camellia lanceoleosa]|uniref:E3 ubiquitin-protein ligase MBR2 n=1 Tax=Camellia lanceoleosa TaxID=1840588 RepID=A0ACC0GB03_9ERIC|nr:E3 ubiquitin-protein ligase MBR2 [Camellia lanceoleosa]
MGRAQGSPWRGVPNWPSPVAKGFIPFQHGPPPVDFHPVMQQFPPPPMFSIRPSMELNQSGVPYHVPDGDRFSSHGRSLGWRNLVDESCPPIHGWDANNTVFGDESHIYGRLDWDHHRRLTDGYSAHGPADDVWAEQTGLEAQNDKKQPSVQVESVDIDQSSDALERNTLKAAPKTIPEEIPNLSRKDGACLLHVYLSMVDISPDLTQPELYSQYTDLMGMKQNLNTEEADSKLLLVEEAIDATVKISNKTSSGLLFPTIKDSVLQNTMSLYKKLKEEAKTINGDKLPFSNVENLEAAPALDLEVAGSNEDKLGGLVPACGQQEAEVAASALTKVKMEVFSAITNEKINEPDLADALEKPEGSIAALNKVKMELNLVPKQETLDYIVEVKSSSPQNVETSDTHSPGKMFNTAQMFEADNDQSWNHVHPEQPYCHLARSGADENSSLVYPVENMSIDGVHYASHWNPAPRSNGFPSSSHSIEVPHFQTDASGPSHDPFLLPSAAGSFSMAPENYAHHASSSDYGGQIFHGVEGGFVDVTMTNGRGTYKRKSPSVPAVCERGSSSGYYNSGNPPDLSSDTWQEKPNTDSHHAPWDCTTIGSSYRGNSLSIGGEATLRNVRSRAAVDLETNLARTHLSGNPSHHSYTTGNFADHSGSVELMGQSSNMPIRDWSHIHMSPVAHGRIPLPDANVFSHETNHFIIGSSNTSAAVEIGGYHNDMISSRTPIPQNLQGTSNHSVRTSDEGLQLVAESYSSRHPRPLSTIGWRNSDRSGRTRISSDRYRSLSDEAGLRGRLAPEGLMIVDRSALYGSRNLFDQHRDMRLDIDNMSYEELLALGERIGSVSTGMSEDLISKCLTESIYCSSDQFQEEGKCVICLEEYKNMDDVGTMKTCGHDFHVDCIKKWLEMKNLCPICKGSALADHMKEK